LILRRILSNILDRISAGLSTQAVYPSQYPELESLRQQYISRWRAMGASQNLINMALELADEWAQSMLEAWVPPSLRQNPTVVQEYMKWIYPKALQTADRWITAMSA